AAASVSAPLEARRGRRSRRDARKRLGQQSVDEHWCEDDVLQRVQEDAVDALDGKREHRPAHAEGGSGNNLTIFVVIPPGGAMIRREFPTNPMLCPRCGSTLSATAVRCPRCAAPLGQS